MYLNETPHISLRKANGLINIDYSACDIIFNERNDTAAARSYNTVIGIYTKDNNNNKIYLETAGSYSQTTAGKHKPRARRLAEYNNYKIIPEIKPAIIESVSDFYYKNLNVDEIIKESQERRQILTALYNNEENAAAIKAAKLNGICKARRQPESTSYKNGNYLTKYFYIVEFKYLSSIYYELNSKAIKTQIETRTGTAWTNQYKNQIVNISE